MIKIKHNIISLRKPAISILHVAFGDAHIYINIYHSLTSAFQRLKTK